MYIYVYVWWGVEVYSEIRSNKSNGGAVAVVLYLWLIWSDNRVVDEKDATPIIVHINRFMILYLNFDIFVARHGEHPQFFKDGKDVRIRLNPGFVKLHTLHIIRRLRGVRGFIPLDRFSRRIELPALGRSNSTYTCCVCLCVGMYAWVNWNESNRNIYCCARAKS